MKQTNDLGGETTYRVGCLLRIRTVFCAGLTQESITPTGFSKAILNWARRAGTRLAGAIFFEVDTLQWSDPGSGFGCERPVHNERNDVVRIMTLLIRSSDPAHCEDLPQPGFVFKP